MKVSFGQLYPTTLGFERMFRDLESILDGSFESSNEKFPPHNIIKLDEARYVVELAVAGFNQDESGSHGVDCPTRTGPKWLQTPLSAFRGKIGPSPA